ncbi:hypothetical protein GCM10023191_073570 [Actinoallomurus oryzae]|uniref:DUF676 domain-containing protein n=1 Tax=Actinoallomurus oryzae TaxID=502180 RepID=A0ABP8QT05_9ACTN
MGRQALVAVSACLVMTAAMAVFGMRPAHASVPRRMDSASRPILFIHGNDISGSAYDCNETWHAARTAIEDSGWTGQFAMAGLYKGSKNCTYDYGGDKASSITDLGKAAAWNIYHQFSKRGEPIDVITHSMGGLVIRAAIAGVAEHMPNWPPYLYVEDVATLGAPHQGAAKAIGVCGVYSTQCGEMAKGSRFLKTLPRNPQSAMGTDWTLIGSVADTVVDYTSEIDEGHNEWAHKVDYPNYVSFSHSDLRLVTTGTYGLLSENGTSRLEPINFGASPVVVAKNALYWSSKW